MEFVTSSIEECKNDVRQARNKFLSTPFIVVQRQEEYERRNSGLSLNPAGRIAHLLKLQAEVKKTLNDIHHNKDLLLHSIQRLSCRIPKNEMKAFLREVGENFSLELFIERPIKELEDLDKKYHSRMEVLFGMSDNTTTQRVIRERRDAIRRIESDIRYEEMRRVATEQIVDEIRHQIIHKRKEQRTVWHSLCDHLFKLIDSMLRISPETVNTRPQSVSYLACFTLINENLSALDRQIYEMQLDCNRQQEEETA